MRRVACSAPRLLWRLAGEVESNSWQLGSALGQRSVATLPPPDGSAVHASCSDGQLLGDSTLPTHSIHAAPSAQQALSTSDWSGPVPWADACAAAEGQRHVIHVFHSCAQGLDWVHSMTGLPWWASIPLCTLSMRLLLLPISLRQAKIIRTNYTIYKEAVGLTDRQLGSQPQPSLGGQAAAAAAPTLQPPPQDGRQDKPSEQQHTDRQTSGALASTSGRPFASAGGTVASGPAAGPGTGTVEHTSPPRPTAAQLLLRSQTILHNFNMLRVKCDVPHPIWIIINPLIQLPCFILLGLTLRMMGAAHWPGFETEGTLWFPDLTQVPLVLDTMHTPMGPVGFIMPLGILGLTMVSLRMGVGASGARMQRDHADDNLGRLMRIVPPLLYTLAVLNLYVKVQQPHAALLHWLTSSGFTLSLQLSLQSPTIRQALKVATPQQVMQFLRAQAQAALDKAQGTSSVQGAAASATPTDPSAAEAAPGAVASPTPVYQASTLPLDLVARVKGTDSADVLVIMGAQLSAQHRYGEAMYCLDHALQLNAQHTRAHYSRGQVFSLLNRWLEAEECFRTAAHLAQEGSTEKGQAVYCMATALHTQGKLPDAIHLYQQATSLWQGQTVVLYSLANALLEAGRLEEAREAMQDAMRQDAQTPRNPFKGALMALQARVQKAEEERNRH